MLRKAGFICALVLSLPTFANAWTLTAKIGSGAGTITSNLAGSTPLSKTGNAPVVKYFKAADGVSQTVSIAGTNGNTVSSAFLDGVRTTETNFTLDGPSNHSLIVYYTAGTSSITVQNPVVMDAADHNRYKLTANGAISVQALRYDKTKDLYVPNGPISRTGFTTMKPLSMVRLYATPNAGYVLDTLTFNGGSIAPTGHAGANGDVAYADVQLTNATSYTAAATFKIVPQVTARILVGTAVTSLNNYPGMVAKGAYATAEPIPLDVTKSTGNVPFTSTVVAYAVADNGTLSPATVTVNDTKTSVSFATAGTYMLKLTVSATGAVPSEAYSPKIKVVSLAASQSGDCLSCHAKRNPIVLTSSLACADCHKTQDTAHKYGAISDANSKFNASIHWNSETGHETDADFTAAGHGSVASCAAKCHFNQGKTTGCAVCHSDALQAGGDIAFATTTSIHGGRVTNLDNTCYSCHTGTKHGKVPNEFFGSKHWQNSFENGPEFTSQMDATYGAGKNGGTTVLNGAVTLSGATDGYLNPNDSYTTTENGKVVTCAYRCHFRPGMGPKQDVAGYLAGGKATTYTTYTDTLGKYGNAGQVYSRPGGDSCMACHDPHGLAANTQSTCYTCHAGGNHGWSVVAFEKSSHFSGKHAGSMRKDACVACHNPHSTEAAFFTMSSTSNLIVSTSGCQKCHATGSPYGIYNADRSGKAPHFDTTTDNSGVAYMNAGNTCSNCHGHNNVVNGEYAKSGHGDVTSPAWEEGGSSSSCVRCHTTKGFINYSGFHVTTAITDSKSVLSCNACHTQPEMRYSTFGNLTTVVSDGVVKPGVVGTIRSIKAFPAPYATNAGAKGAFTFPDVGPSNICIPCHAGRTSGNDVKAIADFTNANFKNSHYAAAAAVTYKSIGYEFAGQNYADPAYFKHGKIGVNRFKASDGTDTGIVGPCASCHFMDGPGHTLRIFDRYTATTGPNAAQLGKVSAVNSTLCAKCHSGANAFTAAAANENIEGFEAALAALQAELQAKGVYYNAAGVEIGTSHVYFTNADGSAAITDWTLGVAGNGANNMGAAFNLQLLTKEPGAWAHNRVYAKRLIFDSIDWLQNGSLTGSIAVSDKAATYLGTTRP